MEKSLTLPKLEHRLIKELIANDPSHLSRRLHQRLAQAERDGYSIRRAVFFLLLMCLLTLSAAAYCAILSPEILLDRRYHLQQSFGGVFAGGVFCLVVFCAYYVRNRSIIGRLYREGRHRLLALADFSFNQSAKAGPGNSPAAAL